MTTIQTDSIEFLTRIREKAPLIHNITNLVVMNSSANILLAIGASPVMAHCRAEVEEMTSLASALVLNIGTIQEDWLESMICAAKVANSLAIPVILDPVGAGATKFRNKAIKEIMANCLISVVRGNASEIFSLSGAETTSRGVDSSLPLSEQLVAVAKNVAVAENCTIAISGEIDCITDGRQVFRVHNGHPIMTRVTGTGCGLSAVIAAFCSVAEKREWVRATAAAVAYYGLCGDLAAQISTKPGSFQVAFVDQLYSTVAEEILRYLKVNSTEGAF